MDFNGIGEEIRLERKRQKLSQKELAKRLGVTHALIGQYERGERHPKLETIRKIADALGVNFMNLAPISGLSSGEDKQAVASAFFKTMMNDIAQHPNGIEIRRAGSDDPELRIPEYQPLLAVVDLLNVFGALPALKKDIEEIESKN